MFREKTSCIGFWLPAEDNVPLKMIMSRRNCRNCRKAAAWQMIKSHRNHGNHRKAARCGCRNNYYFCDLCDFCVTEQSQAFPIGTQPFTAGSNFPVKVCPQLKAVSLHDNLLAANDVDALARLVQSLAGEGEDGCIFLYAICCNALYARCSNGIANV